MKLLRYLTLALISTLAIGLRSGYCETPIVFVSLADFHGVEKFLKDPAPIEHQQYLDFLFSNIAKHYPSFVLMPGDLGSQHWWNPKFDFCAPGGTLKDIVLGCAAKSYPNLLASMAKNGLNKVFVAVGDHDIGDNDWPLGRRSEAVPYFKKAFGKYFTKQANGTSRFPGTLFGIPKRPVGTPYEHTSYAFQAGNTLFVAVDEFQQLSPTQVIGLRGTVRNTVTADGHLQWLDSMLAAARTSPTIEHIIVFGHMPVLSPVRADNSSAMYIDNQQDSFFWRTLRKHKVDAYLGGEVHRTTAIKDPYSNIVQIISGTGADIRHGFLLGKIFSDRIEFEQYIGKVNRNGSKTFVKESTLTIDKTQAIMHLTSTGTMLKPVDPRSLIVHYSFDDDIATKIKNYGSFGDEYDGNNNDVQQIDNGPLNKAAQFSSQQRSKITGVFTPNVSDQPRTISAWIKTNSAAVNYIYSSGFVGFSNSVFRLFVNNGILGLQLDTDKNILANQGNLRLNDGNWHHVAVVFPGFNKLASDTRFYINGYEFDLANPLHEKISTHSTPLNIGGNIAKEPSSGWDGGLDDFGLCGLLHSPHTRSKAYSGVAIH